ncbi:MAG: hypothetical protein ACRD8W_07325 [Nitrososphaeraceae archaeon]
MANDKRFVKLDATWKNYGRKDEWERFFEDEHVDTNLSDKIRKKLESGDISVMRRKFSKFVTDNLPDSFWNVKPVLLPPAIDSRQILRTELAKILWNLYQVRSKLFHIGDTVGGDVSGHDEEMLIQNSIYAESQRLLNGEDPHSVKNSPSPSLLLIPNYQLFERMAHDSILCALNIEPFIKS